MTRVLILISGVLAVILPNIGSFNLPPSVEATITAIGGVLLSVLAYLEHPTTTTKNVIAAVSAKKGP